MKQIGAFILNNGDEYKVLTKDTFFGTPAMTLLREFNTELERSGFTDEFQFTHAHTPLLFAAKDDFAIGYISYYLDKDDCRCSIASAYIRPAFRYSQMRDFSVYDCLFKNLVEHLEEHKPIRIVTSTHINNKAAQKAFERQGRVLESLNYTYLIK